MLGGSAGPHKWLPSRPPPFSAHASRPAVPDELTPRVAPRRIGDRSVFPVALGTASAPLADLRGAGEQLTPELEERAIAAVHDALDCGINVFDTARAYTSPGHPGHGEQLLARALRTHPAGAGAAVATKAGHERVGPRFPDDFPVDTRPSTIRRHLRVSLELLNVKAVWLLQLHWPPADGSMAEAMRVFADLLEEGLIENVGICNVSHGQIAEAQSVVPLASVQNQFSPFTQHDRDTVEYCAEHDIAYLAYSPLGGASRGQGKTLASAFPGAERQARDRGVSVQTLALAWLLALSPTLIPVSGASSPETVRSSALAASIRLTQAEADRAGFGVS